MKRNNWILKSQDWIMLIFCEVFVFADNEVKKIPAMKFSTRMR